jgi:hypothetical protein
MRRLSEPALPSIPACAQYEPQALDGRARPALNGKRHEKLV